LNGLRNGKGIWTKPYDNGFIDVYHGEYINDKKSGHGVFTWANGNEYNGEFLEDYKHGHGEMAWTDGRSYKGMWDRGKMLNEENIISVSNATSGTGTALLKAAPIRIR
jgi:hypothetical protein